jgi:PAS domain S-box-containing protein
MNTLEKRISQLPQLRISDQPRTSPLVWATPLVGIILFILAMGAFFYTLHSEDQSQAKLRTIRDVELARQTIRTRLLGSQERLIQIARSVEQQGFEEDSFRRQANSILGDTPEVSSVLYIDQEREATLVVLPRGRSTEVVHDPGVIIEDAESYWAFATAKEGGLPVFARPFLSISGAVYTEIHVPVFVEGKFKGVVAATLPISAILNDAVPTSFTQLYLVSVVDSGGNMIASNSSRSIDNAKLSHEVQLDPPGHGLKLRAVLYRTTTELFQDMLTWAVLGLSAVIVWSFILLYRHSKMRNQAEKKLLAETKFRRAMENSVITGMRAFDMQGRITYVNPAFCKMTGYKESELVGMTPPFPYWPENSYQEQEEALRLILSGRAPRQGLEVNIRRRDGSIFAARMYVSPLVDSEGSQSGWMTSVTDITEPRRVREELAAAHRRFVRILEELDAAVVVEDPQGDSPEPIFTNRLHKDWFSKAGPPGLDKTLNDRNGMESIEWLNPVTLRWYEVRRRPISWVDGRTVLMQVATDISSRKETEKVNRQQQEKLQFTSRLITLGELASSLAHELNQPLTAIANYTMGGVARLKAGTIRSEDLLPVMEKVSVQAQRAGDVIRRIREFVKQQEPNRSLCLLDKIIQDAIGFSRLEARNQGTRIVVNNPEANLQVVADAILIEQVLMNLIKNGIEAMSHLSVAERVIEIHVTRVNDTLAMVRVRDYGSGVPEEIRERLFESFFTTKSNGMGMGLNICRTIIEYHQGQLWVDPAPNGGSEFKFTLPTSESITDNNSAHKDPTSIDSRNTANASK